ncbi:MAG: hypothetical protein M3Y59_06385 [Myxococcota bacterium]|nr:hypothetical protein [Myxococcota bacterium]
MHIRPLVLIAALVAACTPTLTVPPGAQITCAADTACPDGFRCNADTELCVNRQESPPVVSPTLQGPSGQTAVKPGDALGVSGTAEVGAQVVAVRLVNATSGAELQVIGPASVVNAGGTLSGTFTAATLLDAAAVAVEVIVQARGYRSIPENSRSLPVTVDATAPSNASVALAGGGTVVSSRTVTLAISAVGADQLYLDGDLDDAANVRTWIPYGTSAQVTLTGGDGAKTLTVGFRDGAHNALQRQVTLTYDSTLPSSRPALAGPWAGVTKVKNSDVVTVTGTALAGAVVHAALLRSLDGAGLPLPGAGCSVDVTSQVSLGATGVLGGSLNIGTPCAGTASIDLEVIVRNGAGTQSLPGESRSNVLGLDNQPPGPATGAFAAVAGARTGFTRFTAMSLLLGAELDGTVEIFIDGDVSAGRIRAWVPFPGDQVVPGEEPVTLTTGNGPKTVTVRFRDELANTTGAINITINLDTVPPPAPVGNNLELVETSPAPNDPAQVASSNNSFTLTGLDLALVDADRVELFSDAALSSSLGVLDGLPGGRFPATVVPYNAAQSYFAQAIDPAGNRSVSATRATVPMVTAAGFILPAMPGRSGAAFNFSFTLTVDLASAPAVTVAGRAATCAPPTARTYFCSFTPNGSEPEGAGAAVIRVVTRDGSGQMSNTTAGSDATTATLDFTAPTLTGSSVSVAQNDPGMEDQISGGTGAVSDNLAPANQVQVRIFRGDGTTAITALAAASNGSFAATSIGDNTNEGVVIRLEDPAGNLSAGTAFANDVTAPVLTGLTVSPPAQHAGANVLVSFNAADASDLRALPSVTVASRAATHASGTSTTSDGAPHPFSYTFGVLGSDAAQSHPVSVTARDVAGNATTVAATVLLDHTAPVSANTTPGNRATWNGSPSVLGTASDALSGVERVELSLRSVGTNSYWNGTAFAASTETFLSAAGTTSWSYATGGIPFVSGESYVLRWRAVDVAGNVENTAAGWTFTYDPTLPPAPSSLTALSGPAKVALSWAAAAGATSYRVYYDVEAGSHPPFAGTGALEGPSPITVTGTSLTVNALTRGRYVFAVTAIDGAARESGYSPQAAASSQYWKWSARAMTTTNVAQAISTGPNRFLLVGDAGTVWRSDDGGSSWTLRWIPNVGDLLDVVQGTSALIAVGTIGIARSTDGGSSWTFVAANSAPGSFATTTRMAYATGSKVVVVNSANKKVQYSSNDGQSFTLLDTTLTGAVRTVSGSGNVVIAFGTNEVSRSLDGGATWVGATTTACDANAVYLSGAVGAAGGGAGRLVVTSDGGATWAPPAVPPLTGQIRVVVGSGSLIFAADSQNGVVARSADGGATWTTTSGLGGNLWAGWTDGTTVVLTGPSNGYSRSTDGGLNWTNSFNLPPNMLSLSVKTLASDGVRMVAGASSSLSGSESRVEVATSPDLGASWAPVPGGLTYASLMSRPWSSGTTLVTSDRFNSGTLYRSTDDGETWTDSDSLGSRVPLVGGDTNTLFIGIQTFTGHTLRRSTNAGQSFTDVASYATGPSVFSGIAGNGSNWVAVTENGYAVRSTDGGLTWASSTQLVTTALRGVHAVGSGFIAYGANGVIRRSTDGGATWATVSSGLSADLRVAWVSPDLILLGGNSGTLLRSGNGGANFTAMAPTGTTPLSTVTAFVCSGTTCLIGGQNGDQIWQSADSGATWTQRRSVPAPAGLQYGVPVMAAVGARFYSLGVGQPVMSEDGGVTWLAVPEAQVLPVPISSLGKAILGGVTGSGMPLSITAGGALVFGPP